MKYFTINRFFVVIAVALCMLVLSKAELAIAKSAHVLGLSGYNDMGIKTYYDLPDLAYPDYTYIPDEESGTRVFAARAIDVYWRPDTNGDYQPHIIMLYVWKDFSSYPYKESIKLKKFDAETLVDINQESAEIALHWHFAGMAVDQGKKLVYVITKQKGLYIFDADTLERTDDTRWLNPIDGAPEDIAVGDGKLFVADGDNTVHRFDTTTWEDLDDIRVASAYGVIEVKAIAYDSCKNYLYAGGPIGDPSSYVLVRKPIYGGTSYHRDLSGDYFGRTATDLAVDPNYPRHLYVTTSETAVMVFDSILMGQDEVSTEFEDIKGIGIEKGESTFHTLCRADPIEPVTIKPIEIRPWPFP